MGFSLVAILVTWHLLIGGVETSGCNGVDYKSLEPVKAPCTRDSTCDIETPQAPTPQCRVLFGNECRYVGQGQTEPSGDVTTASIQSPPAILTRLGIEPVLVQTDLGPLTVYNFFVWIGMDVQDVTTGMVRGVRMEFQSRGDNHNCHYQNIPVCRLFSLSQGYNDSVDVGENRTSGGRDASSEAIHRPGVNREKLQISHSCFGLDVLPGSFLIRLTSLPGASSSRSLDYQVKWEQPDYDDYYNYNNNQNEVWPFQVVGLATEPGTNQIHVVIQRPSPDNNGGDSVVNLALRDAGNTGNDNNNGVVQNIQIMSYESSAMFSRVPMGRYHVLVSIKGHHCEFDQSCPPPFTSDVVFVDTELDLVPQPSMRMVVGFPTPALVLLVVSCVVIPIGLAVFWARRRRDRGCNSLKAKHTPSILVISLDKVGRLKWQAVKYLADSIQELLPFQTRTVQLSSNDIGDLPQTGGDKGIDTPREQVDFLTGFEQQTSTESESDSLKLKLKTVRQNLKQYRVVVLVRFLSDLLSHSEITQPISEKNEYGDVIDFIMTSLVCRKSKRVRTEMCLVYFTESSSYSQSPGLSTFLASSGNSSNSDNTVDSFSTVTGLIPAGGGGGDSGGGGGYGGDGGDQKHWRKGKKKKTPSTSNVRRLRLENNNSINTNITMPSPFSSNHSAHTHAHTFFLPLEVVPFLDWLNSCHRHQRSQSHSQRQIPTPVVSLRHVNQCDKWQAALTCSTKAFVDRDYESFPPASLGFHDNQSECFTIITEDAPTSSSYSKTNKYTETSRYHGNNKGDYKTIQNPKDAVTCSMLSRFIKDTGKSPSLYRLHDNENGDSNCNTCYDDTISAIGSEDNGDDCITINTGDDLDHVISPRHSIGDDISVGMASSKAS